MTEQEQHRESLHLQLRELIWKLRRVLDNGPDGCIPDTEEILKNLQTLLPELEQYIENTDTRDNMQ